MRNLGLFLIFPVIGLTLIACDFDKNTPATPNACCSKNLLTAFGLYLGLFGVIALLIALSCDGVNCAKYWNGIIVNTSRNPLLFF